MTITSMLAQTILLVLLAGQLRTSSAGGILEMKIFHLEQLVEKMGTELERLRSQGGQQTLQLTGGATISISPGGATILSASA